MEVRILPDAAKHLGNQAGNVKNLKGSRKFWLQFALVVVIDGGGQFVVAVGPDTENVRKMYDNKFTVDIRKGATGCSSYKLQIEINGLKKWYVEWQPAGEALSYPLKKRLNASKEKFYRELTNDEKDAIICAIVKNLGLDPKNRRGARLSD